MNHKGQCLAFIFPIIFLSFFPADAEGQFSENGRMLATFHFASGDCLGAPSNCGDDVMGGGTGNGFDRPKAEHRSGLEGTWQLILPPSGNSSTILEIEDTKRGLRYRFVHSTESVEAWVELDWKENIYRSEDGSISLQKLTSRRIEMATEDGMLIRFDRLEEKIVRLIESGNEYQSAATHLTKQCPSRSPHADSRLENTKRPRQTTKLAARGSYRLTGINSLIVEDGNTTRLKLRHPLSWAFNGAWASNEAEVVLADAFTSEIVSVPISAFASTSASPSSGSEAQKLLMRGPFLASGWGAPPYRFSNQIALVEAVSVSGWRIGFGDVRTQGEAWQTGLWVIRDGRAPMLLLEFSKHSPFTNHYYVGNSFLAKLGEAVYFLKVGPKPSLLRVDLGERPRLKHLDDGWAKDSLVPEIPAAWGKDKAAQVFKLLEEARAPVGLFASNERLYLLRRAPSTARHGTTWRLSLLDPVTGALKTTFPLATSSPHLLAIPGQRSWAFLEKGHVVKFGVQAAESILIVRSSTFQLPIDQPKQHRAFQEPPPHKIIQSKWASY